VAHVLHALEAGADGVCVVACPEGECEFLGGSRRAWKRVERARSLLEEIGLGGNRAVMIQVAPSAERGVFEEQVLAAARGLEALGASPLRKQGNQETGKLGN
jgi:coenzyme F420-reducing hydrogenase delta subunit